MKHIASLSRELPASAGVLLPGFPGSHTIQFLKENWPQSLAETIDLIVAHIPFWSGSPE